jgi:hypothetical protein
MSAFVTIKEQVAAVKGEIRIIEDSNRVFPSRRLSLTREERHAYRALKAAADTLEGLARKDRRGPFKSRPAIR